MPDLCSRFTDTGWCFQSDVVTLCCTGVVCSIGEGGVRRVYVWRDGTINVTAEDHVIHLQGRRSASNSAGAVATGVLLSGGAYDGQRLTMFGHSWQVSLRIAPAVRDSANNMMAGGNEALSFGNRCLPGSLSLLSLQLVWSEDYTWWFETSRTPWVECPTPAPTTVAPTTPAPTAAPASTVPTEGPT